MYNVYLEVLHSLIEFYPKLQQIQYAAKDRKYRESAFPPPEIQEILINRIFLRFHSTS